MSNVAPLSSIKRVKENSSTMQARSNGAAPMGHPLEPDHPDAPPQRGSISSGRAEIARIHLKVL